MAETDEEVANQIREIRSEMQKRCDVIENHLLMQQGALQSAQEQQAKTVQDLLDTMGDLERTVSSLKGVKERVQEIEGRAPGKEGEERAQGQTETERQKPQERTQYYDYGAGEETGGRVARVEGQTWQRKFDGKSVAHLRDNKLSGKDGGAGWANFFEDMGVAMGAVEK